MEIVPGDNIDVKKEGNQVIISTKNVSIESSTADGGWTLRRFSDGYIEMTQSITVTGATWREEPYGYYYVVDTKKPMPNTLLAKIDETVSMTSLNASRLAFGLPASGGSLSERATLVAYCLEPPNGLTDFIYIYKVTGRWK